MLIYSVNVVYDSKKSVYPETVQMYWILAVSTLKWISVMMQEDGSKNG